jgi:hypothetical protein
MRVRVLVGCARSGGSHSIIVAPLFTLSKNNPITRSTMAMTRPAMSTTTVIGSIVAMREVSDTNGPTM